MQKCDAHWKELWSGRCRTLANERVGEGVMKITLDAPEFARRAKPGQFLMLRLPERFDPLLGRPFAVYDADAASGRVQALYAIVGKGTRLLAATQVGEPLELWGPLGNGWDVANWRRAKRLALVSGGVGTAPFYMLLKEIAQTPEAERPRTTFVFGARSSERLTGIEEFRALGVADGRAATEDGSAGTKGFATDALADALGDDFEPAETTILACGPTPMLRAVARWSASRGAKCWTSLESSMACGLGVCFSCVVEWRTDEGTWDYRRACVDGPVFDAARLNWES